MSVSLSILIPVYTRYEHLHEELGSLSRFLTSKSLTHEIILIDNTPTALLQKVVQQGNHIKIVRPAEQTSQQRSYIKGFHVSEGDWALLLDHDLLGKRILIDTMLASIDEQYDVIRAIRQNRTYQNWFRLLGSKVANCTFNLGSTNKLQDIGSSLALLKRESYKFALCKEYEKFYDFPLFILVVRPLEIKEIEIDASESTTKSEYSLSKLTMLFLRMAKLKVDRFFKT